VYVDDESGVTISAITSFVGTMPGQASELYSNNMFNLVEELCLIPKQKDNNASNFTLDLSDEIVNEALVSLNRELRWIPYDKRLKIEEEKKRAAASRGETRKEEERTGKGTLERRKPESKPEHKESREPLRDRLIEKDEDVEEEHAASMNAISSGSIVAGMTLLAIGLAYSTNYAFMMNFLIFTLALVIGYIVVWGVDPLLHASLMSETNAISGIIIIGAMLQLYGMDGTFQIPNIFGTLALFFASINMFGGFVLTDRMLRMISC